LGGRSPPSFCGRRSAPLPPVAGSANPIFLNNINIGDSPMFQQAPMMPIFDVQCVHRPNPTNRSGILPLENMLQFSITN